MPLSPENLAKLTRMQTLSNEVDADILVLDDMIKTLKQIDAKRAELTQLYQNDWLTLTESTELSDTDRKKVDSLVVKDGYSILGEDTIWNNLSDIDTRYQALHAILKAALFYKEQNEASDEAYDAAQYDDFD